MTNYLRVIPRDLFNEAKLLKCMGRLVLNIHNETTPVTMVLEHDGEPFEVAQLDDDGSLTIDNIKVMIGYGEFINTGLIPTFKTVYNSKLNYPLYAEHEYCEYKVFEETGEFHIDFIEFCKRAIVASKAY